jgi:hypothetical protein
MGGYRYRCGKCKVTSPPVARSAIPDERRRHRAVEHGGYIPDGESVIEPERFHFSDVPRQQWIFGSIAVVFVVIAILIRAM